MAAGDVTVSVVTNTTTAIDTAVTNARVNANSKYFFIPMQDPTKVMFIHIEEA